MILFQLSIETTKKENTIDFTRGGKSNVFLTFIGIPAFTELEYRYLAWLVLVANTKRYPICRDASSLSLDLAF